MKYENLPIYKASLDFCVYVETIVKNFDRYHKYTIGADLRNNAKDILFLIHRANIDIDNKPLHVKKLVFKIEDTKVLINLCKELKVYKSFNSYEYSLKLIVLVAKQATAWYKNIKNKQC